MGTVTEGGNYVDPEGGLFISGDQIKTVFPRGNQGEGKELPADSFLPDDEKELSGGAKIPPPKDESMPDA